MQRKVFRIEQMLTRPRVATPNAAKSNDANHQAAELAAVREAVAATEREVLALRDGVPAPRLQKELAAATAGMETATQKILKAAEGLDESGRALMASLKNDYERGLAQDLLDQVVQIYEACNFQDLAGQRIAKAIAAFGVVEQQSKRLADIWGDARQAKSAPALLNGPKLGGDSGHAAQADIDRMFA